MTDILRLLVEKNLIEKSKATLLASEANSRNLKIEELLLAQGLVDEATLFDLKSKTLAIPLRKPEFQEIFLKVLELIPEESAKYYKMVPLSQKGRELEIGMVYPEDSNAQEALKFLARQGNFSYKVFLITLGAFEGLLKQYRSLKGEMTQVLAELEKEIDKGEEMPSRPRSQFERFVEEAPVTKIVAVILRTAVEGNASDIHIEPAKENVRVRFRLLGELHSSLLLPLKVHPALVARIKILSSLRIDETRIPQDGRFSASVGNIAIDFRVSTLPTALGEKVAIRVLDPTKALKEFDSLGLQGESLAKLKAAIKKPYGLILSTGPTGSGKTTTLYAVLHALNREGVNIVSLEDPVEYLMEGVNQSQVRPEIGYDFASGLRQILRQDPNIIMVGEVRDKETASLVVHASLTGHVVLSSLHTNNALGVIPRLLDMGIDKYLIPPTLSIALSQRLIRRLCEACKVKTKAPKAVVALVEKEIRSLPAAIQKQSEHLLSQKELSVFQPKGCKKCSAAGFSGRIGIFEVIAMTDELAQIVLSDPSEINIAKEAIRQGMVSMRQDGILKVLDGMTTIEEVLTATES
ncbi:MAG: Flp pilus assembly complex ATPase component TadA [Candidatus Wildermuthbacteria bacterium]|nr:Flp pilus assembly complex ATPase component TadA [Candidatus Wildermuthbacteria bacterium]